jgi:hypothetical protein
MIDRRGEQLTHGFVVEEFFFFFFLLRVSVRGETSPLFFQPCPLSIPTALVAHLPTTSRLHLASGASTVQTSPDLRRRQLESKLDALRLKAGRASNQKRGPSPVDSVAHRFRQSLPSSRSLSVSGT